MDRPSDPADCQETQSSSSSLLSIITRELFSAAVGVLSVYLSAKLVKRVLDPSAEARERNRERRNQVITRLQRTGVPKEALHSLSLSEESLLHDLVFPEDIHTTQDSVGGLKATKETLRELIIYPLLYPELYSSNSSLLAPPKGVLLYGPPGTGKTMLARWLARESGANFLALSPSTLLAKYVGETEQLARGVFSLARRVQPTIIFIDEIDGMFRERTSNEHEVHKNLKAEFMQLWDGLFTDDRYNRVIILGATNRPYDVDPAILRRMPRSFEVALPDNDERIDILHKVLDGVEISHPFDYGTIADATEGFSGSDLKELCRAAMQQPLREGVRTVEQARRRQIGNSREAKKTNSTRRLQVPQTRLRPLTVNDVLSARRGMRRTHEESSNYRLRSQSLWRSRTSNRSSDSIDDVSQVAEAAVLRLFQMMQNADGVRPS